MKRYTTGDYVVIGFFTLLALPFFFLHFSWTIVRFIYGCLTIQKET